MTAAASLDGMITTHTIYFIPDLDRAFGEIARALKRSARAVIGLGDPDAMESFARYGFRIRPLAEVVGALELAGLSVMEHRRVGRGSRRFHILVTTPRRADDVEPHHAVP